MANKRSWKSGRGHADIEAEAEQCAPVNMVPVCAGARIISISRVWIHVVTSLALR